MAGTGAGEKKAAPEPARDYRSNHLLCALNFVQKVKRALLFGVKDYEFNFLFQCYGNSRWHVNVHFIKKTIFCVCKWQDR